MNTRRRLLFDRAVDLALLRSLYLSRDQWRSADIVFEAVDWLITALPRVDAASEAAARMRTSGHMTLKFMLDRGLVGMQPLAHGKCMWKLASHIGVRELKLLTGGVNPLTLEPDEAIEYDLPNTRVLRDVEFDPGQYVRATSAADANKKAYWQCPSPWALGERMQHLEKHHGHHRKAKA